MKQCLNCQTEFQYKRGAAKFCSNKCRAAYNRAHPKQSVTPIQMQVLYNSVLEAINQINARNGQPPAFGAVIEPIKPNRIQSQDDLPTFQSLLNGMASLLFADDKNEYELKIRSATHLTDKQRELLLNNLRNLRF